MITINTTPSGADIYVEGKRAGKSPLSIQAPKDYRGEESIKIEARLEGHENKLLLLGDYYPEHSKFILGAGGGRGGVSIFGSSSIGRTTPGYYKFPDSVNIKLEPKKP
ncbi:MAG: PEGA domain-containing protein [Nitrospinota bacterium]|nr:PEGA domain-containing protein [Nitrospinota bacterium]